MDKQLIPFIESIKSNKKITSFDEESTKQAIVMKLLFLLGWNIFNIDEVKPNYPFKKQQIEYALRLKNLNKIFIKAKKSMKEVLFIPIKPFFYKPLLGILHW